MTPITTELKPCAHEIEACEWKDVDELAANVKSSAITLRVLQLVQKGLDQGFDHVTFTGEKFKSVYKGKTYQLFNRPVEKLTDYAFGVADDSLMKNGASKPETS